jgi:hypothetical protein
VNAGSRALLELLPAIYRTRDAEWAATNGLERGPLEELMAVLGEQVDVAEEALAQLYDDLFIETCADWVVPYIGDLIGYRALHEIPTDAFSQRAEVAHTIALRRRKGTALVLEQLARDVTGWDSRVVEYFQKLCTTQYMNHPRLQNLQTPDLRQSEALEWIGTAFEGTNRTLDVRNIESRRGRHNIASVGLHLWRITAYGHHDSPAFRAGPRRYRASPLNHDLPLFNRPRAEQDISHIADPENVPWPLSRRRLHERLGRHYGIRANAASPRDNPHPGIEIEVNGTRIERDSVRVCNLSDQGSSWAHSPPPDGVYAIDPVLGRVSLPGDAPDPADVRLTWYEGFGAAIGGGEYERGGSLPRLADGVAVVRVPDDRPTLAAALTDLAGDGIVEITDNSRYTEVLTIEAGENAAIEIRAANGRRPVLDLGALTVRGGDNSACILNGLLITGSPLEVPEGGDNRLSRLSLLHCTLVPGRSLRTDGAPTQPGEPSLLLALPFLDTFVGESIIGGVRSHERAKFRAESSILDSNGKENIAFAALDGNGPGAALVLEGCTVVGKVHAAAMTLVSNSILLAALAAGDSWSVSVRSERKQSGCIRFSWLPHGSVVPRRHRCQPDSTEAADHVAPGFRSLHYGTPAYAQLSSATHAAIRRGADDESEMGVYHHLYGPQRETNLGIRLAEYLRVGLRAGIFYES